MDFFWGGTKVPAVVAGTRPRPPWTTCLGLLSSLLHLGLRLSVPLWRPRLVYVSVSVLRGLRSAHPPSLVVLLRHGTCLPGGGSYVRPLSCVSCVPASCFLIWLVSCPRFMSLLVNSVPGVCVCVIMSLLPCVFKSCLLSSMSSGLLVIPGVSMCLHCPVLP